MALEGNICVENINDVSSSSRVILQLVYILAHNKVYTYILNMYIDYYLKNIRNRQHNKCSQ